MALTPTATAAPEQYGPLTKSIDIDEVLMLVDLTQAMPDAAEWREEALFRLPQASRSRRLEIVRSVQQMFVESEDDAFVASPLRTLLTLPNLPARCKRDLILTRYLQETPLVWHAIRLVVLPKAIAAMDPRSGDDAAEITVDDWNAFLEVHLRQYTDSTFSRTRGHITAHLTKFGLLESHPIPGDRIAKRFFARFYDPDPRAFWFSLAQEFAAQGTASRSLSYVVESSWTRVAFCCKPTYARYAVEEAERQALVNANFYGSEKQITFRGSDPVATVVEAIRYG